jgi:hypothetical protein
MGGRSFILRCIDVFAKDIYPHETRRLYGNSLKAMSVQAFGIGSQ